MSSADEEGELDPAMERVRRKLMRLLMVSTGVMVLGLAAVAAGIVYRVSGGAAMGPAPALDVAPGEVVSATAADGLLVLVISGPAPRIEVRRVGDGGLVQTFPLTGR